MEKISFNLDPREWHLTPSEALWAEALSEKNAYRIHNTPFCIDGISYLDEVVAITDSKSGFLEFGGVVLARSGHSTYRIVTIPLEPRFLSIWQELEDIGCSYEGAKDIETSMGQKDLFAVDVPPQTDIYAAYRILERGEADSIWQFQEGHVGQKLQKDR
jgi:hypothetical protein